ncbi:MAG: zinc dependent phospholipase C family protein [Algoriphagus sp.]|nr:zinc dependent phospholipase C family protein [Algoriphagus sp.]
MNFLIFPFASFLFFLLPMPFWGFFGHALINRQAVYSLPPEMLHLYKKELAYLSEKSVNPDRRRYAVKGEAEKHYIDLDHYGDSVRYQLPKYWAAALKQFPEDSLRAHGIGPWSTYLTFLSLTQAFAAQDKEAILRLSADLGHYLGDLNVPLHTTKNYNGQLTGQAGIHGFWESRVPELLAKNYTYWVGKAAYVPDPQQALWEAVHRAHAQVDSVLRIEKILSLQFPLDQKYSYAERNGQTVRVYSREFTIVYALALDGQVERQMKRSIKMIADFWYTAWVNGGQPDLSKLPNSLEAPQDSLRPNSKIRTRTHDN